MKTLWSLCWFWLISCLLSPELLANSYKKGLDAYRDGEHAKAYKILSSVVSKAKGKSDKAEAMVLMGAAAVKMGKKAKGEQLFSKALEMDGEINLPKDVAKDKAVKKLFSRTQKGGDDGDGGDEESDEGEKSGGGMKNPMAAYYPFGAGYLMNNQVSKGLIYGGAQAAGLLGYLYYSGEIDKANKDADAVGKQALADQAAGKAVPQQTTDFLNQNEAFVKSAQSNQKLMILVLLGGYGLSVADPYIFGKKSGGGKKRAEQIAPRSYGSYVQQLDDSDSIEEGEVAQSVPPDSSWDMHFNLIPWQDPTLLLSLQRRF